MAKRLYAVKRRLVLPDTHWPRYHSCTCSLVEAADQLSTGRWYSATPYGHMLF